MAEPLRARLLGDFRLEGTVADLATLRSRKARTLLKVLALHRGQTVSVDALTDALWSNDLPADPARDLSVLASRARAVVGNDRLVRREAGYALLADWCDRDEVAALTREAARRHRAGDLAGARVAAEAALALGSGELVADEGDAEWARPDRREAAAVIAEARAIAAAAALASGHHGDAAAHARAALAHDPCDETALRLLMRSHVLAGRPASALSVYAETRTHLAEELGVSPSRETEALHDSILLAEHDAGSSTVRTSATTEPAERSPFGTSPSPGTGSAGTGSAGTGSAGLVGRDRELSILDDAFACSQIAAEVVLVRGEAGVGKTALVEHWAATVRATSAVVVAGRASEATSLALQPVLDALAATLPSSVETMASHEWTGIPGPSATVAALQIDSFRTLGETLRDATPGAGLVLVIDDIQFADATTLAWLASVLRRPREHPFLVVANVRIEDQIEVPSSRIIDLGPLDQAAVAVIVGPERAARLWQQTGGNALFVTELAAYAAESDAGGGTNVASGDGIDVVPASIRDAVVARLRRIDAAAATTLRTAALLGPAIDLDLLAGVLGVPPLEVLAHLDEGVRRALLAEADGQLMFRHDLVRAALAADATAIRRMWVHRQAAELLRTRQHSNPLEIARHARGAGDLPGAAAALADAADVARSRFDLDGALALLGEAVAADDSASVRLRRSRLHMARGDIDAADRDAEAALGRGGGASALELRAWAARNRHDMESAIRLGTAGAELAGSDPTTQASCLVAVALAHRGLGELQRADQVMSQARDLHPDPSLGLPAWLGVLRVHQGRPLDALAALEPMVGAEAGGLLSFWVEHVLQMLAHSYGHLGRAGEALTMIDRLEVELARRGSNVRYAGVCSTYRSWILRNLGEASAADVAVAGLDLAASTEIRAQLRLDLADALLTTGRTGEAVDALERAQVDMQTRWFHNRWRAEQRAATIRARLQLADGLTADALATAAENAASAEQRGDARYATISRLLVARANGRLGNEIDAGTILRDVGELSSTAALESWWLAHEVAVDTGLDDAQVMADRAVARLVTDAGEHADALRLAAARRFR